MTVPGEIKLKNQTVAISALLDSGSDGNFIDAYKAEHLGIPLIPCELPLHIRAIDNKPIGKGHITHRTVFISLRIGCLHRETISLLVINSPGTDVIRGLPWLT